MKQEMFIDCRVSGSNGDAVRIMAILDNQNDQVIIAKLLPYTPSSDPYKNKPPEIIAKMKEIERQSIIVVDNPTAFRKWDICFNEKDHLQEAIKNYYMLKRTQRLVLGDEVLQMCDPSNVIEVRKTDLHGNVIELNSDEVTNGHFAVMIACWSALKMRNTVSINEVEKEPTQHDIDTFNVPFSI